MVWKKLTTHLSAFFVCAAHAYADCTSKEAVRLLLACCDVLIGEFHIFELAAEFLDLLSDDGEATS